MAVLATTFPATVQDAISASTVAGFGWQMYLSRNPTPLSLKLQFNQKYPHEFFKDTRAAAPPVCSKAGRGRVRAADAPHRRRGRRRAGLAREYDLRQNRENLASLFRCQIALKFAAFCLKNGKISSVFGCIGNNLSNTCKLHFSEFLRYKQGK